ncbi:glycoside hydrolase family 127 protein [Kribbella sp. NPDC051586]|uniref:glycoside hydrolase family 127 protein n=1 Tax=Kribbella sp. NPDC051586 TaxID=3364118 RepID=UPI0037A0C3F9
MLTDTGASAHARMTSPSAVSLAGDGPLAALHNRALAVTIPSMGAIMLDPATSHADENFRVAAGDAPGEHQGPPFMDGDLYKWLEAAVVTKDPGLEAIVADAAKLIARAQRADGYLHTKIQIAGVEPLAIGTDFETYNFGHLMTLACIHYRATGDDTLLGVATRIADFLAVQSPEKVAECNVCPSHYMGVIELYRVTGEARYLELARTLLDLHGGKGGAGTDDNQDVLAVRDQRRAVGHSVRANYLYAGMADYAVETGDEAIIAALDDIWDDLTSSKLYVTGGCGALYDGASPDAGQDYYSVTKVHQSYGRPYQLPQTTAYNESCASLGLVFWAWRMLLRTGDAKYADEIERVLFNALPAMVGYDGQTYFYVNPLRQVRDLTYPLRRPGDPKDVTPPPSDQRERQEYMQACFCCPPNIARVSAELPYYVYAEGDDELWIHQFVTSEVRTTFNGVPVTVRQRTDYPVSGDIQLTVEAERPVHGRLRIRIPGWADTIEIEGPRDRGYVVLDREWHRDTVTLKIPLRPRLLTAHHFVEEVTNQVCVVRGPIVYCLESADLPDGVGMEDVAIPQDASITVTPGSGMFAGHALLHVDAAILPCRTQDLYAELDQTPARPATLQFVPYGLWANRGHGEMTVWLPLIRTVERSVA